MNSPSEHTLHQHTSLSARDILRIMSDNLCFFVRIDLDTEQCEILKEGMLFGGVTAAAPETLSSFQQLLFEHKIIHPEDEARFLQILGKERLHAAFCGRTASEMHHVRWKQGNDYDWMAVELMTDTPAAGETQQLLIMGKHSRAEEELLDLKRASHAYTLDPLTRLFNRMKYEHDLEKLAQQTEGTVTCIYIDVIGLHELNNHLGHEAGDQMLEALADGLRRHFPGCDLYRIGGDEFVVLARYEHPEYFRQHAHLLREELRSREYEISVGLASTTDMKQLSYMITRAEAAMREDKTEFYRQHGNVRQMRSLNKKLEEILLKNQDTGEFLRVIASSFMGVYLVDMEKDRCRYIYIPEYFRTILTETDGCYSAAVQRYGTELVRPEDLPAFNAICDYDYIRKALRMQTELKLVYQKKNGVKVRLRILRLDHEDEPKDTIWMFM